MDKRKIGNILGSISMLPVIISIVIFYVERGPNADVYLIIKLYFILSISGFLFSILSWMMSKRLILLILGLLGNATVLAATYLLLLAMGISEA